VTKPFVDRARIRDGASSVLCRTAVGFGGRWDDLLRPDKMHNRKDLDTANGVNWGEKIQAYMLNQHLTTAGIPQDTIMDNDI